MLISTLYPRIKCLPICLQHESCDCPLACTNSKFISYLIPFWFRAILCHQTLTTRESKSLSIRLCDTLCEIRVSIRLTESTYKPRLNFISLHRAAATPLLAPQIISRKMTTCSVATITNTSLSDKYLHQSFSRGVSRHRVGWYCLPLETHVRLAWKN